MCSSDLNFLADRQPSPSSRGSEPPGGGSAKSLPRGGAPLPLKIRQFQGPSGKRDFGFQRRFLSDLLKNPPWVEALRKMSPEERAEVLVPVDDPGVREALSKILEPLQPNESDGERIGGLLNAFREQPEIRNLVAEATMRFGDELPPKDLESSLKRLRFESLDRKSTRLNSSH